MPVFVHGSGSSGKAINKLVLADEFVKNTSSGYYKSVIASGYLFVGLGQTVYKHNIDTLAQIGNYVNVSIGANMSAMTTDGTDIYASGLTTNYDFKKYNIAADSNTSSSSYGGYIRAIETDDTYVYVGGSTTQAIKKCSKSNISTWIATGTSYGSDIYAIVTDDTYVYYAGAGGTIVKALKSNLAVQVTSITNYGGAVVSIVIVGDYLYAVGSTTKKIFKYNKNTLEKVAESSVVSTQNPTVIRQLKDMLLIGDAGGLIYEYSQSTLTLNKTSLTKGATISDIAVDSNNKYFFGIVGGTYDKNCFGKYYTNTFYK